MPTLAPAPAQPPPRRHIAVVIQRYGRAISGGAEWHAWSLVQALLPFHDITVLTSCAIDATTWALHFPAGITQQEGVTLKRFPHPPRNEGGRARVPLRHKWRFWLRAGLDPLLAALRLPRVASPTGDAESDGHAFLQRQGPACDGLIDELRRADYDAAVFFTALYHPTAEGLPVWGRRSVLIPTLHDEKPMMLPWFHRVFSTAGQVLYNTAAERRLARRLYGPHAPQGTVVGAAVQVSEPSAQQVAEVRQKHALNGRYLVYVGRIEKGKGCDDLLTAWRAVAPAAGGAVLVFVGKGSLPIPSSPQLRATGFVSDAERDALVAGAEALVMPSRYESLSLVLLEALALGVPALANAGCEVLADQLRASGAGATYRGRRQLRAGLLQALARTPAERGILGERGRRWVAETYGSDIVTRRWLDAVERACAEPR